MGVANKLLNPSTVRKFYNDFVNGRLFTLRQHLWHEALIGFKDAYKSKNLKNLRDNGDINIYVTKVQELKRQFFTDYDNLVTKYDFEHLDPKAMATIYHSTIACISGRLHMSRISQDRFQNITRSTPLAWWGADYYWRVLDKKRNIYKWTMDDQYRLCRKYISLYFKYL